MKAKVFLILTVLFGLISVSLGQTKQSGVNELIQKAIHTSKEAFVKYDTNLYKQSIGLCERALSADPQNPLAKYYLAYNQYRLLIMPAGNGNLFDDYFSKSVENLKSISNIKGFESEANALLAAVYMMKLARNQSEAPAIAQKVYALLGKAQAYDSLNPRVYLVKGIMLFHTPKMFGGSIQKALDNFNKAIPLFKNKTGNSVEWGYLETLAWKGQALTKLNKPQKAEEVYNKALKTEPEFSWIKHVLLPALQKQISESASKRSLNNKQVSTLNIIIKNLSNNKGNVRIGLSNSEESYESNIFFKRAAVNIKNQTAKCTFKNVPYGTYAIKFYHDENKNKELDKNMFGMPTEDYGFSNDATGNFGPASFEDAKFTVNKKVLIIKMNAQ